jgi:hypothetical protein
VTTPPRRLEDAPRAVAFGIIICLFAIQAFLRFRSDLVGDAAWYLYVADGLLHGKQLYVDYIEVNPPLAVWIMVPIAWLGAVTSLGAINSLYISLLGLTAASIALVNRYIAMLDALAQMRRYWLCVLLAAIALFLPAGDFGEREHFMVLLFMPWLFLRVARHQGARPSSLEAIVVGLLASLAICIKPQSVFAPLAIELLLLWRYRKWRPLFAPENLAALACAMAYVALLIFKELEFMHLIVRLGVEAYMPFFGYPAELIWIGGSLSAALIVLALMLSRNAAGSLADVTAASAAGATGFLLSYFIQYKGFSYQVLPALVFASIACATGALAAISQNPIVWSSAKKLLLTAIAALALMHMATTRQACICDERISAATIATYAPNAKSVFIASIRVGTAFPLVVNQKLVWASRLPSSWLTPYVASNWQGGALPQDDIIAHALDWTVADLAAFEPEIVLIDESTEQLQVKTGYFDYVKFWSNDPRFADLWAKYERRATVNDFAIYTLK